MDDVNLKPSWRLEAEAARALAFGAHADPFAVLGPHETPDGRVVRAFLPGAVKVDVLRRADREIIASLQSGGEPGLFENLVPGQAPYLLRIVWPGAMQETEDPYSFGLSSRRPRPASLQRRPAFRIGALPRRAKS